MAGELTSQELRFMREHQEYIERVDRGLVELMKAHVSHPLWEPMMYSLKGGKRLRPLVVLLVNEALGPGEEDPVPATAAVELLHTVSLIHDDVIDREDDRRGRMAYYKRYGLDSALLSADFVLGIILDITSRYKERAIGGELARAAIEMSAGEELERKLIKSAQGVTWEEYVKVLKQKTASLFRAAAALGALLSSKPSLSDRFSEFGLELGMAYQLRDDLSDMDRPNELIGALEVPGGRAAERVMTEADRYTAASLETLRDVPPSPALSKLEKLVAEYF